VLVGIVLAATFAVMTGSVLILGYAIAAASLLLMSAVRMWKLIRRRSTSQMPRFHTRWVDVSDREAA
jgi:hypothetical protein